MLLVLQKCILGLLEKNYLEDIGEKTDSAFPFILLQNCTLSKIHLRVSVVIN